MGVRFDVDVMKEIVSGKRNCFELVGWLECFVMGSMGEIIFHSGWHEFYSSACTSSMRVFGLSNVRSTSDL